MRGIDYKCSVLYLSGIMPAALDIDREQVQMMVLTYGVREAARMLGLSEDTVATWSARGRWLVDRPASVPLPPTVIQAVKAASPVNAFQNAMKEDALHGRAAQLRLGRKTLEELATRDVDELLTSEMSTVAKNYGALHAQAAGYAASDSIVKLNLGVTANQGQTIEAEIVTQEAGAEELP